MTFLPRAALAATAVGACGILVSFASAWTPGGAPVWGVWCMIAGTAVVMSAMLALGALRSGIRSARVGILAAFLLVVIVAGFGTPLLLEPETSRSALLFGLPVRFAIELFGVGLLPAVVFPVAFALEFRETGLDEAGLADLRRRAAELRPGDSSGRDRP